MTQTTTAKNIDHYAANRKWAVLVESMFAGALCIAIFHSALRGLLQYMPQESFWLLGFFVGAGLWAVSSVGIDAVADGKHLNAAQKALVSEGAWNKAGLRVLEDAMLTSGAPEMLTLKHLRRAARAHAFEKNLHVSIDDQLHLLRLNRDIQNQFSANPSYSGAQS